MVFALCQFTESQHMFFLTIGGDGSRQVGSDALIFIRLLQQKSKNISSIHIGKHFYRKNKWFLHFANLHKDSTCFFHYWRRREPPVSLRCDYFHSAFTTKVKIYVLFLVRQKFFLGKTKGLGTLPIYISKSHVFFSLLAATGAASIAQRP